VIYVTAMARLIVGYGLVLGAGLLLGFEAVTALARVGFLGGASVLVQRSTLGWADALWVAGAAAAAGLGYRVLRGR
jgi:hypothetical protein